MTGVNPCQVPNLGPVMNWEELGRRINSSSQKRKAANTGVPLQVFLEKLGVMRLSVDRLSTAPSTGVIAEIAERQLRERDEPREFYGWAVVEAGRLRGNGYEVEATRTDSNPYHADILLPPSAADSEDALRQHATALAGMSSWRSR